MSRYRRMWVHVIENQEALKPLGASSKMNAEWAFLTHLRDLGRETAQGWLDRHFADIGARSTVDLRAMFQGIGPQHQGRAMSRDTWGLERGAGWPGIDRDGMAEVDRPVIGRFGIALEQMMENGGRNRRQRRGRPGSRPWSFTSTAVLATGAASIARQFPSAARSANAGAAAPCSGEADGDRRGHDARWQRRADPARPAVAVAPCAAGLAGDRRRDLDGDVGVEAGRPAHPRHQV